jgi:Zn2+/Cd2+-exporting ATPase
MVKRRSCAEPGNDLSKIPWLIRHSRRMMTIIHANIALPLIVKAVFRRTDHGGARLTLAAMAGRNGVELLVIFNALRLLGNPATESIDEGERFKGWRG